ncbi:MAG: RNA-binding S4 domain-containing protein [Erysipelotrichaceae bacterium]|nr:RNA-binding S4 domain-containing protein [Erysipelotrichaceae bacterium]
MRLDKYLKVTRILKRRTISKELAMNERVLVNGKVAKPSYEVKLNDEIEIIFGQRHLKVRVLGIKEVVRKNDADVLYEVIEE